ATKKASNRAWGGRFKVGPDRETQAFTASIGFDVRLAPYDVRGGCAHARMLAKCGIIKEKEAATIVRGLKKIERELAAGTFVPDIADEDIHMAIERRLIETIGPTGAKVHAARSRNDQVITDVRLFTKDAIESVRAQIRALQSALIEVSLAHPNAVLPGYTHLQRAQPVLLAHHLLAYHDMLVRDDERMQGALVRTDILPLGAGAMAGTTLPIDREMVAQDLGFSKVAENSMDAVADRDFILEFLSAAAIVFSHISRLAGEITMWASAEFGFVRLHDAYSTGSSMMPQKKNPDIAELVRGKTGRVIGNLVALLTTIKGLPLAYNSDLQEDKESLFDTADTAVASLRTLAAMVRHLTFDEETMRRAASDSLLLATDLAEFLVAEGVAFRDAHEAVGSLVRLAVDTDRGLDELMSGELLAAHAVFDPDKVATILDLDRSIARRTSIGGTSGTLVRRRLRKLSQTYGLEIPHS
ncbi:MAG: argininosuccinate lyase, partial [Candidatus Binatia bacterium]